MFLRTASAGMLRWTVTNIIYLTFASLWTHQRNTGIRKCCHVIIPALEGSRGASSGRSKIVTTQIDEGSISEDGTGTQDQFVYISIRSKSHRSRDLPTSDVLSPEAQENSQGEKRNVPSMTHSMFGSIIIFPFIYR